MMLPNEIKTILKTINNAGSEAYAVGGCVRDLLCEKNPKDWDVATSATPEEIQTLFPDSHYENNFGTVIVKTESADPTLAVVEVTTYRKEEAYTDKRRPDRVTFTQSLKEDLQRRDFTMNAIAMSADGAILDPFDGEKDLETKAIRAVGDANKRFNEDALRLLRAVRFIAELGFTIEEKTIVALNKHANSIKQIAWERIGDEFKKLIMGPKKEWVELAIETLHETDLLSHIMPELEEGVGVKQAGHHTYHVWEHNLYSLGFAVTFEYEFDVRLGALLHDVGKPRSKKGEGENATFYNHEIIGATMTHEILTRLRYSKALIKKVRKLVRWHLFYYEVDEVTPAAIRRLIKSVGKENIEDLVKVRMAERKGSGVPKKRPYRLRHMEYMIEKVLQDPLETSQLAIDGNDIMKLLNLAPGQRIGLILNALLAEVIEDPKHNTKKHLEKRSKELHKQKDEELIEIGKSIHLEIERRDKELKQKYYVK